MVLSQIIEAKRRTLAQRQAVFPLERVREEASLVTLTHRFKVAISRPHKINLIAELKKASPVQGVLRQHFDPASIATIYSVAGAAALSVLTEEAYFLGHLDYIRQVAHVGLPVLRKDFIIDEYQIYESIVAGADAILLISDLLTAGELERFLAVAAGHDLDALVEVRTEEDIEKSVGAGAEIIGINNRDLHTFRVDLNTTRRLVPLIPRGKIIVSESGIHSHDSVMLLKSLGVQAILAGEVFMRSDDIAGKVRELLGH